jgi:serine acetyltransferase
MNDNDIQAAATILGSMIVSNHPKVSANKIVSADVEWSVFAGMCIDLAEAISHEKHSRTTSGTKRR